MKQSHQWIPAVLLALAALASDMRADVDGDTAGGGAPLAAADSASANPSGIVPGTTPPAQGFLPSALPAPEDKPIQWEALGRHSGVFLGLMHGFRLATEPGTRQGLKGPFFSGYADSLGAMHGWSDGDPFLVNYVGHPMQGAVAGYLLIQHDPKYQTLQFGRDKNYWKSRLRAMGYAWAFSTQFEIGPISEATIGNVQSVYPAYGFVDHVITPTVGIGWLVAEDALDKYLIRRVERSTDAAWLRMVARIGLNPSRSMANLMSFRMPWRRDDRPTIYWDYEMEKRLVTAQAGPVLLPEVPVRETPVAEFTLQPHFLWYSPGSSGSTSCIGGGAVGQWNTGTGWSLVADVGGCKLNGLGENRSGDSLTYLFGPRWSRRKWGRVTPHVTLLVGGNKVTEEELLPERIRELEDQGIDWTANEYHSEIANDYDKNAFALMAGGGVDVTLRPALSLQLANFDYMYTGLAEFQGRRFTHAIRFTAGVTLRLGTW